MKIWVKMFSNFWTTGILKELVITVSNELILINTFFHFGIFWKPWCPKRHDFEKNRINHLITPSQAIDHKTNDLETYFSNSSEIMQKMMSFRKKLIISNLVCIKTCYSFEPAKTLSMTKNTSPKTVIPWNHLWLMPWGMLTKIINFSKILLSHNPLFGQKW